MAFILELIAFVAVPAVAWAFGASTLVGVLTFLVLFVLLIGFWAGFMAPRASRKLGPPQYYVAKVLVYAVAAFVLLRLLGGVVGLVFLVVCLIDELLLYRHKVPK